ncbi:hypothetical protein [Actinoplanes sp. NPDC026619]|uniref:hypothetical protein n=1 Tax=Actinoplanes sp. NPDC026619 TaxID=3155798 RepID=UPI003406B62F
MAVDMVGTIRLLHRVFGFLTGLSADELKDVAEGRRDLLLDGPPRPGSTPAGVPVQVRVPANPAAGKPKRADVVAPDDAEYEEIAAKLRGFTTLVDGETYLKGLRLRGRKPLKADLVRLGSQMGLTLSESATVADLQGRLVNHAIGAKKKYAGLSQW